MVPAAVNALLFEEEKLTYSRAPAVPDSTPHQESSLELLDFTFNAENPHIQLYEFETILLCQPEHLARVYGNCGAGIAALQSVVAAATSPEVVNDGKTTAPSKRIIEQFPHYRGQKTTVGVELAHFVGIDTTRSHCVHFDRWLKKLESLGAPPAGADPL